MRESKFDYNCKIAVIQGMDVKQKHRAKYMIHIFVNKKKRIYIGK